MKPRTELSEETIAHVLGRAAQIDAQRGPTKADLVEWAGEAGISPEAVKAALLEMESPPPTRIGRVTRGVAAFMSGTAAFIVGAFVRIVAADPLVVDRGLNMTTPYAVAAATIGMLAMSKSRSIRERFQILNALVWGCYVSGWSIANGVATENIMMLGIVAAIASAVAGGIVTRIMDRRTEDE